MYSTAIPTFKRLQSEINDFTRVFSEIGKKVDFVGYFCRKFNIDCDHYSLWLENTSDFAELVVLYLGEETKEKIKAELTQLKQIIC
jgi:hypothetical protein